MNIVEPSAILLWCTDYPELTMEEAGRTCYKSDSKYTEESAAKFIEMILKRGHESVLEHASASFRITTDRGISHEIVRHRLASYSQESTRYCNYGSEKFGNSITVVKPSGIIDRKDFDFWQNAMLTAEKNYFDLLDRGFSPQVARSVLPTCLKTEIVMTANFREWRHFLKLRLASGAHPDIILIAKQICAILQEISPAVISLASLV